MNMSGKIGSKILKLSFYKTLKRVDKSVKSKLILGMNVVPIYEIKYLNE